MHQSVARAAELESRVPPAQHDPFLELLSKWRELDAERSAAIADWDHRTKGYPDCVEMVRPELLIRAADGSYVSLQLDNLVINASDAHGVEAAARVVDLLRAELRVREEQRLAVRREVGADEMSSRISAASDAVDAIEDRMLAAAATTWEGCVERVRWAATQDLDPPECMRIVNEAHGTMIDLREAERAH